MATNPTGSRVENFRRNLSILWQGLQDQKQQQQQQEQIDTIQQDMTVVKEALRAAMAWTVLYVFFFVLLLGYKWQAKGYYEAEYERKLALLQTQNDTSMTTIATPWWTTLQTELEAALSELRDFAKLQSAELRKVLQQKAILEEMRQALEQLDDTSLTSNQTHETTPFPFQGSKVESLLKLGSLAEIQGSTTLQTSFEDAVQELRELLHTPEKWDWAMIQGNLSASLPPKQPSLLSEAVRTFCAGSNDNLIDSNDGPIIPSNAAHESDLEKEIRTIQSYVEKRHGDSSDEVSHMLFPDTLASLERATQQRIHVILEMILASAGRPNSAKGTHASSASPCLSSDDVIDIVEEGLGALQLGASLRNVMRKKIMELDPSVKSIILDADLTPPIPKIPDRETTNLRRLLETPLVLQLGSGIDHLVELAGGYNDQLDQWLDSVAGGRESIGEMVVRRLLEKSGKVEIPSLNTLAKQYLPMKAQTSWKKKSK